MKVTPSVDRSIVNADSVVELSVHSRLTVGPVATVAARAVGAAGTTNGIEAADGMLLAVIVGNPLP